MTAAVCAKCGSTERLTHLTTEGTLFCWRCAEERARPWQDVVREVVDILSQTRHTFRSKQVERARKLLATLIIDR